MSSSSSSESDGSPVEKKPKLGNSPSESPPSEAEAEAEAETAAPEDKGKSSITCSSESLGLSEASPTAAAVADDDDDGREKWFVDLSGVLDEETYWRNFDDVDHPSIHDYVDEAGERHMTDDEYKQYCQALQASAGFDVPAFPEVYAIGIISPIDLNDDLCEEYKPMCIAAIKQFNDEKHTNYEYVKLLKANHQAARGIQYYLTFEATATAVEGGSVQTFQAKVLLGIPEKKGDPLPIEVGFCRLAAPATIRTS